MTLRMTPRFSEKFHIPQNTPLMCSDCSISLLLIVFRAFAGPKEGVCKEIREVSVGLKLGSVKSSRCQKEIKFAYRDRYHSLVYVVK